MASFTLAKSVHGSKADLLDHLIGAGEDRRREGEAEGLGGVEIYDQLKRRWLNDWQVGGISAFENHAPVDADLPIGCREARSIADQAAGRSEFTVRINRWNGMARGQ